MSPLGNERMEQYLLPLFANLASLLLRAECGACGEAHDFLRSMLSSAQARAKPRKFKPPRAEPNGFECISLAAGRARSKPGLLRTSTGAS